MDFLSPITAPSPSPGDDSTLVATTEWVNDAIAAAIGTGGGGGSLSGLSDVDFTTAPTDGQALVYDATSSKWHPATLSGGGGPVDLSDYYTKEESDAAFQPLDDQLTGLAGLVPAANKLIYYDVDSNPALTTLAPFTRGLLDNTSAAEWRSDLGIALGSQIQAWDIVLDILSSVSPATDTIPYFTDSGHGDTTAFTQVGRDIVGAATQADAQTALGVHIGTQVQGYSDNLQAIADLTTSADTLAYWTGTGDAGLTALTPWARGWLALADNASAASAIGAQQHYPTLDYLGTLETSPGELLVGTAAGLNVLAAGTLGQTLVANPSAGGGMSWQTPSADLFGFGDLANQNSDAVDITGGSIVGLSSLQAGTVETGDIEATGGNISGVTITNLPDPVNDQDAATKAYVIAAIGSGTTDDQLLALAALTPTANTVPIFSNDHTAGLLEIAPWSQGYLGSTDSATAQAYLGLVPNSSIMAYDGNLVSISGLSHAKGNLMVGTGSQWDVLSADIHDGWVLQVDGSQPSGYSFINPGTFGLAPVLENLANLSHSAGQFPIYTGDQTWSTADTSSYGLGLINTPDAATLISNLGLVVGTNVQAQNTRLDQLSSWVTAKGDLLVGGGGGSSIGVLPIGTDHQFLMADSTAASGMRWYDLSLDVELPSALNALASLDTSGGGLLHYTGTDAPELLPITPYSSSLFTGSNAAAWQGGLGLTLDGTVQRHNVRLDTLAALGWAANKGLVFTGSGSAATFDLSDAMMSLLGSADNAALLTSLGLEIGTDVQAWHAGLDDLGSMAPASNGTIAVWKDGHWVSFPPGDDTQILQANSLYDGGLRWLDLFASTGGGDGLLTVPLQALSQVNPATDRLPYFTSDHEAAVTPLTSFARTLIDDIDASHMRTTLGLQIGTDIQAYSTKLDAISGMTWAANKGIMATGSNALGTFDITAAARTLLDDASIADMLVTLGLSVGDNVQAHYDGLDSLGPLLPTKGNVIVGDGTQWRSVGVGADGQVLTADSSQVAGVKWDAGSAGVVSATGVDVSNSNLLTNPFFLISQENGTNAIANPGTTAKYPADQWYVQENLATAAISSQQIVTPFSSYAGYESIPSSIKTTVTTAQASIAAGENLDACSQPVEGRFWSDLKWGTAGALDVDVFGYVLTNFTGKIPLAIGNGTRSYVAEIDVTANQVTPFLVTVPGDTSGAWAVDESLAATVRLGGISGSSAQATANTWTAGDKRSTAGCTNWAATVGNFVQVGMLQAVPSGVFSLSAGNMQTETKKVVTMRRPYDVEKKRCHRYWQPRSGQGMVGQLAGQAYNSTSSFWHGTWHTEMRAAPSIVLLNNVWGMEQYQIGAWSPTVSIGYTAQTSKHGFGIGVSYAVHGGATNSGAILLYINSTYDILAGNARLV